MTDFSVLISLYHKENPKYLRKALDSVFGQTLLPNEIVLVKDGPLTPTLEAILDEFSSKYPIFKFVVNETNLGLGRALAKGVLACSYEIIARMDTDDIIPSDRFEKQLAKMDEGYDVVSCWTTIFKGDNINDVVAVKTRPEHHEDIVKLAHKRSPVGHPACFLRKEKVLSAGNYIHCLFYEDYHLWIRMILSGAKFYNCQESLYYLRTTTEQIERRGGLRYLKNEIKAFKEFKRLGFYTTADIIRNSLIRIFARLSPNGLRAYIFKVIWNHKS